LFPLYLTSSIAAIAFAPSAARRTILLGGILGMLAQGPITKYGIAPIAVDIKEFAQGEEEEESGEKLLEKWNTLSIYRMGLSVVGIGTIIAALVV